MVVNREVAQVLTNTQVIVGFSQRSASDVQETGEFGRPVSTESFGDIPWSRRRSVTYLISKFEVP